MMAGFRTGCANLHAAVDAKRWTNEKPCAPPCSPASTITTGTRWPFSVIIPSAVRQPGGSSGGRRGGFRRFAAESHTRSGVELRILTGASRGSREEKSIGDRLPALPSALSATSCSIPARRQAVRQPGGSSGGRRGGFRRSAAGSHTRPISPWLRAASRVPYTLPKMNAGDMPPTLEYCSVKSNRGLQRGRKSEHAAFYCLGFAAFAAAVGTPMQYHELLLSAPELLGALFILIAWVLSFTAVVCGIVSSYVSRGHRGLIALILAIFVLALSIALPNFFPSYGLGNLH
jgi:hypothetical protein